MHVFTNSVVITLSVKLNLGVVSPLSDMEPSRQFTIFELSFIDRLSNLADTYSYLYFLVWHVLYQCYPSILYSYYVLKGQIKGHSRWRNGQDHNPRWWPASNKSLH